MRDYPIQHSSEGCSKDIYIIGYPQNAKELYCVGFILMFNAYIWNIIYILIFYYIFYYIF